MGFGGEGVFVLELVVWDVGHEYSCTHGLSGELGQDGPVRCCWPPGLIMFGIFSCESATCGVWGDPRDHSPISFTSSAGRVGVGFAVLKVCWWMPGYSSKESMHIERGLGIHDNRERVFVALRTEFHGGGMLPPWVGSFQESFWDDIEKFCFSFQST